MKSKGYTMVELVITGASSIALVYAFVYSSLFQPLQSTVFTDHGSLQSLTASVSDIKENTDGLPQLKAEVDFLAQSRGYKQLSQATSSYQPNQ